MRPQDFTPLGPVFLKQNLECFTSGVVCTNSDFVLQPIEGVENRILLRVNGFSRPVILLLLTFDILIL